MIVIADTSPIKYLVQIGEIEILPKHYDSILIPPAVRNDCSIRAPMRASVDQPAPGMASTSRFQPNAG
jgi:predicted nucleic acid-binding protein